MLPWLERKDSFKMIWSAVLSMALFIGILFLVILPQYRADLLDKKKEMLRELTYTATDIVSGFEEQSRQGLLPEEQAQTMAKEQLRKMRYGAEGKDYFWINDMRPVMLMHPYRLDLEGKDVAALTDPADKKLILAFVDIVQKEGEGYVDYLWQWKDDSSRIVPKLSFVKGFPAWGWIIGTGIYLNDVHEEIASLTRRLVIISTAIVVLVALLTLYLTTQGLRAAKRRRQSEAELKEYRDSLEIMVEERTAKLQEANLALEMAHKSQTITTEILRLTLADLSLAEILDLMLEHIISFPWYDLLPKGAIFLQEGNCLVLTAHKGLHESLLGQCARVPFGHCLCGRAAASGEVVFADHVDERHDVIYSGMLTHGHYCVPIKTAKGQLLGVFTLYVRAGSLRRDEVENSLMNVASSAAAIILRKRAESALKKQFEEMNELNAASFQLIYRGQNQESLPRYICQVAKYSFKLAMVWLGFIEGGNEVVVAADCGTGSAYLEGLTIRIDDAEDGGGPTGMAIKSRQPMVCNNIEQDQTFAPWRDKALAQGFRSSLAIPLDSEAKGCYGTLNLYSEQSNFFTPERIPTLVSYANHAIAVLENDTLINSLEEKVQERTSELLVAKNMAESADRTKSGFLANMSHELRTPLNSIIGFTDLMLQGMSGELAAEQREYLTDIMESGRHLLSLVNDILDLSKIEAGMMELAVDAISLDDLVSRSLFMVREKAMKHSITLSIDIAPGLPLVEADERRLRQVVVNLLSNAVKFTPDGGEIRVCVSASTGLEEATPGNSSTSLPEFVTLSVADSGPGISEEDQEKLFRPFVQLDSGLTKEMEGTGLGLALCKSIVDQHGGQILVTSELGGGSVFSVVLPVRHEEKKGLLSPGFLPWPIFLLHIDRLISLTKRMGAAFRLLRMNLADSREAAPGWQKIVSILSGKIRSHESYSRNQTDGAFYFLLAGETGSQPDAIMARLTHILDGVGTTASFVQASYPADGSSAQDILHTLKRLSLD